jgi:hypothetical protein
MRVIKDRYELGVKAAEQCCTDTGPFQPPNTVPDYAEIVQVD